MALWWYVENEEKIGPIETEELERLLQSGKLSPQTIFWKKGMPTWQPLDAIEELRVFSTTQQPPLLSTTSSPLPSEVTIAPVIYPLATKWPRFFARTFDIWWENMIVAFALVFLLSRQSADFVEWINTDTNDITFGLLCLPISLILDAFFYYFIGNTPGKALLGLKVDTIEGKSLTFVQYLGRNFSMWLRGLALGFPLFNLVTMSNQASRLGKLQQTSYDEPNGYRVRAKPIVWASKLVFTLAYIILLVFIGASRR